MLALVQIVIILTVVLNDVVSEAKKEALNEEIVNRHDFNYTLNPANRTCEKRGEDDEVFLLIYVHSAPEHFKNRLAIRDTWSRRSMFKHIRIVFMMGLPERPNIQDYLELESNHYNDIVQEDFIDTYRNLTYKGIMAMKWIAEYCPQAQFILKIDDDIIVNLFILLRHLAHLNEYNIEKKQTIMCLVWTYMKVMRNKKSKWYLSKEEYEPDHFSHYCSGSAYLLTNDLPQIMYNRSFYVKFFWVDDFYMTGLLANASNATLEFYNSLYALTGERLENGFVDKRADFSLYGHLSKAASNKMYSFWKRILKRRLANAHLDYSRGLVEFERFKFIEDFHWSRDIWDEYLVFKHDYFY